MFCKVLYFDIIMLYTYCSSNFMTPKLTGQYGNVSGTRCGPHRLRLLYSVHSVYLPIFLDRLTVSLAWVVVSPTA